VYSRKVPGTALPPSGQTLALGGDEVAGPFADRRMALLQPALPSGPRRFATSLSGLSFLEILLQLVGNPLVPPISSGRAR